LKKRLLYIAPHRPGRSPGQRFRFEQFQNHLEQNSFEITYSYILNPWDDRVFYTKGKYLLKIFIGIKAFFIRMRDVYRANNYDIILVYREAHFIGTTFFETLFAKSKAKLVFDFDDAIWLNDTSDANSNLKWMKKPAKTGKIASLCDKVIVGNEFLADYAKRYSDNVVIIPTVINTDFYKTKKASLSNPICIGWTGSSTTIKHFELAVPFLTFLNKKYPNKLRFKLIVDVNYKHNSLKIEHTPWNKAREVDDLDEIDIGIMPLPDDNWSKGKCGFKGIQYMGLGKAAVMSPVGVNTEIIHDGVNGYLAKTDEEWIEKLSALIDSENLRKQIGEAGRKTIEERYSLDSQKNVLLETLNNF
jgi:glycosyltransferase involved in cell wall biosynthesis